MGKDRFIWMLLIVSCFFYSCNKTDIVNDKTQNHFPADGKVRLHLSADNTSDKTLFVGDSLVLSLNSQTEIWSRNGSEWIPAHPMKWQDPFGSYTVTAYAPPQKVSAYNFAAIYAQQDQVSDQGKAKAESIIAWANKAFVPINDLDYDTGLNITFEHVMSRIQFEITGPDKDKMKDVLVDNTPARADLWFTYLDGDTSPFSRSSGVVAYEPCTVKTKLVNDSSEAIVIPQINYEDDMHEKKYFRIVDDKEKTYNILDKDGNPYGLETQYAKTYKMKLKVDNGIHLESVTVKDWGQGDSRGGDAEDDETIIYPDPNDWNKGKDNKLKITVVGDRDLKVGDYYYSDGSTSDGGYREYSDGTSEQLDIKPAPQHTCIGIVTVVGRLNNVTYHNMQVIDTCTYYTKGNHQKINYKGLVLALHDAGTAIGTANTYAWGTGTVITNKTQGFYGYENTIKLRAAVPSGKSFKNVFPAGYAATDQYEALEPSPDTSSGWFFPSLGQEKTWVYNEAVILKSMKAAGGDVTGWHNDASPRRYWGSNQHYNKTDFVWGIDFAIAATSDFGFNDTKDNSYYVRPMLAF